MEKEIKLLEEAVIFLADSIESGEWQGVGSEVRKILGYKKTNQ